MPMSPDGLFPAVGMHSLGEEVRLHLNAELGREDDSIMMVDSYEDEWGRLHDVRVCGTVSVWMGGATAAEGWAEHCGACERARGSGERRLGAGQPGTLGSDLCLPWYFFPAPALESSS